MKELCAECAKKKKHKAEPLIRFLLDKIAMQDNGCPLGRHELRNYEWLWLGTVKDERMKVWQEEQEQGKK